MSDVDLAAFLRVEAEHCRQSAAGNGEYNAPFWVAGIVLERLAERLSPSVEDTSEPKVSPGRDQ